MVINIIYHPNDPCCQQLENKTQTNKLAPMIMAPVNRDQAHWTGGKIYEHKEVSFVGTSQISAIRGIFIMDMVQVGRVQRSWTRWLGVTWQPMKVKITQVFSRNVTSFELQQDLHNLSNNSLKHEQVYNVTLPVDGGSVRCPPVS